MANMICFIGKSFAPSTFKMAAVQLGIATTDQPSQASLVIVCEDTPTDSRGNRDLDTIKHLVRETFGKTMAPVVLTSQVPPGFTRSLDLPIWCQAETLRVKDALKRALNPEQHIVGCEDPLAPLPPAYLEYLKRFQCPIFKMSWEEAEFSKIAINMTLASQVENANRLSKAADKCHVDWEVIAKVLRHDRRIGPVAYLTPGDWKKSPHLLRDSVTLKALENGR